MFYCKITTRTKRGQDTRTSKNSYHEFLRPEHVGEKVGSIWAKRDVTSVSVTRISQGAYLRRRG